VECEVAAGILWP